MQKVDEQLRQNEETDEVNLVRTSFPLFIAVAAGGILMAADADMLMRLRCWQQ